MSAKVDMGSPETHGLEKRLTLLELELKKEKEKVAAGEQMRTMFLDLLAMCEQFETRVTQLEAKANECQYKTKTFVNEHSNIWECISKNLEKKQETNEEIASVGERTEKLEKCQVQFESRLKLLERQKNPSSGSGGGVDLIEPLVQMKVTDSNANGNQPRVGVRPMRPATPWYFIQGPQNHPPYFLPQPPVLPSHPPTSAVPRPPHHLQGPPMAFHPQPQALFSPPPTPPMAMGPLMSLVHAVDVIKEEEYKVVVGREGATLNGIRSCSQASIMIREKKDFEKTEKGNNVAVGKEVEGKEEVESSPGNEVQYEVTYVGTAQQVGVAQQLVKKVRAGDFTGVSIFGPTTLA